MYIKIEFLALFYLPLSSFNYISYSPTDVYFLIVIDLLIYLFIGYSLKVIFKQLTYRHETFRCYLNFPIFQFLRSSAWHYSSTPMQSLTLGHGLFFDDIYGRMRIGNKFNHKPIRKLGNTKYNMHWGIKG